MNRKTFLKVFSLIAISPNILTSKVKQNVANLNNNFKQIYQNKYLKNEFFKFLKNVFNLYPEDKFHELISTITAQKSNDKEIYIATQQKLDDITPTFSIFSHKLPALSKQKHEMAKQSLMLIGKGKTINGYLEVGSSGRYLDYLEENLNIEGERYYSDIKEPGHSITDMVDRGQFSIGAKYIPMLNYKSQYSKYIPNNSLDLVTVFIGFHHCPLELRVPFISSIRNTLRVGGYLILRDHDCSTEDQKTLVALAHDVFNMGTNEPWENNSKEIRNFYSLDFICKFVEDLGFKFSRRTLFQDGDPTKNALMLFTKIK